MGMVANLISKFITKKPFVNVKLFRGACDDNDCINIHFDDSRELVCQSIKFIGKNVFEIKSLILELVKSEDKFLLMRGFAVCKSDLKVMDSGCITIDFKNFKYVIDCIVGEVKPKKFHFTIIEYAPHTDDMGLFNFKEIVGETCPEITCTDKTVVMYRWEEKDV